MVPGKTTTGALRREALTPSVRVSNDALRYLAKPRDVSRMALETSERACVDLALSYARGGFTAVIDGVFCDPDFVDSMCLEMARSGVRPDVFTLDVGLADLLDRNASRTESARVPTDRIRELHGRFEPCGTMLSVRDMPPEEVAADIRDIVESRDTEGGTGEPDQGVRVLFLRHGEPDYPYGQYPDPRRVPLSARATRLDDLPTARGARAGRPGPGSRARGLLPVLLRPQRPREDRLHQP
ncbi:AAA family ATPase [Streptomyces bohaiensis]|uniref:AAA family ATPase n=1 Tax=Streptomyces bohaiensis TaxID=1431344 RepID=UPI003B76EAD8